MLQLILVTVDEMSMIPEFGSEVLVGESKFELELRLQVQELE